GMTEIDRLEPLLGAWKVTTSFGDMAAEASFERTLDGAFVLQRQSIELKEAPDALCVIAAVGAGGFRQHYFDSRGVVRVYEMTFADGVWTLERDDPDFAQRYTGTLSEDGNSITGAWHIKQPGAEWEKDFDLNYERVVVT